MPIILGLDAADWQDPLNIIGGKAQETKPAPAPAPQPDVKESLTSADQASPSATGRYRDPDVTVRPMAEKPAAPKPEPIGLGIGMDDPFQALIKGDSQQNAASSQPPEFTGVVSAGKGWTEVVDPDGNIVRRTGTRAWRNNNPGNIEYGAFAKRMGAVGTDGRFAVFPSYEAGRAAKAALLFDSPNYRDKTIHGAISRYAPPTENDTSAYASAVASAAGVSIDTPIADLTPAQREAALNAMERVEGFRPGREVAGGRENRADQPPITQASAPGGATAMGTIVLDGNFKPSDPMGLMADGNPLQAMADQRRAQDEADRAKAAETHEQNRIGALNQQHNAAADKQLQRLNDKEPGRYQVVDEAALPEWQTQWDAANRSGGVLGDTGRILESGVLGLGQSLTSLADTVFRKIPGGEAFIKASDDIDRWAMGKTLDQALDQGQARARASVTNEQMTADQKNWWDSDKGWFGPAWRDPRSYLRVVGESAPSTVVTMVPGGIMARGAYLRTLAATGSEVAAAAAAARTATVAGAIAEGVLGGADSARNVRDRIAALPADQVAKSDAVQVLVGQGMTQDQAVKAVTEDAATQAFLMAGVATGMFGGMGDRALAKILAEGVGGNVAKRVVGGAVRGAVGEGIFEEAPQSGLQTIAENAAVRTVDPNQQLTEGVGESIASGIAGGGVMGGAMGGAGGAARPKAEGAAGEAAAPGMMPNDAGPAPAPEPTGPIGRAAKHAAEQQSAKAPQGTFVVDDGPVGDMPAGELNGKAVTVSPDQADVPGNMVRVQTEDGTVAVIGKSLLRQVEPAAPSATMSTAPAPTAAPSGAPAPGAAVRVTADGVDIVARVDSYVGDEAMIIDQMTGEVYQVPVAQLQPIDRPAAGAVPAAPTSPQAGQNAGNSLSAGARPRVLSNEEIQNLGPTQQGIERDWQLASRLGIVDQIERHAAERMTAAQSAKELGEQLVAVDQAAAANNERHFAQKNKEQLVRAVRSKLGIPSQDEKTEFEAWRAQFMQNGARDALPESSSDPALMPADPVAAETKTEPLPPSKEDVEANMRFPGRPEPGQRIIVSDEKAGRFAATVERWEGDEGVVRADDGKTYQVPLSSLKVNKLTPKQVAEQERKANPPVDRTEEKAAAPDDRRRDVMGKAMVLPDDKHARLFDLGLERAISKRTLGASQLDLGSVNNPELRRLADEFKVSPQAVESMADDYRYRVQNAAKTAQSDMPQYVGPVPERRLKQWQLERANEQPVDEAQQASIEMWWDADLTAPQRREILQSAGIKRPEGALWRTFTPGVRKKLEAVRAEMAGGAPEAPATGDPAERTFKTAKGSTYVLHSDGTTTRTKAERSDPGHEGDKGEKPRTARTVYVDTNAAMLSAAGLSGLGPKGARVAIRDGKASLVIWNRQENRWGVSEGSRDIPISNEPKVGSFPLELWNRVGDIPGYEAYSRMHAGNAITEISEPADQATQAAQSVDDAAHEAATSPNNDLPEPTQAQKEAGNYRKGHISLGGLDISIENPAGSERKGVDKGGKAWSVTMKSHYGYIKGTVGRDKDHIDVFIKPGIETLANDAPVYVIDQVGTDGKFDEHKVMLGYGSQAEAEKAYLANYTKGWALGPVTPTTLADFKGWLEQGNTAKPFTTPAVAGSPDQDKARIRRVTDEQVKAVWGTPAFRKVRAGIKPHDPHRESSVAYQMIAGWLDQTEGKPPVRPAPFKGEAGSGKFDPIEPYMMGYIGARDRAGVVIRASQAEQFYRDAMKDFEKPVPEKRSSPTPEKEPQAQAAQPATEKPVASGNKIFTDDAAEKARALLKSKLNQLNSGIDPEILQAGITLAGYHIEKGARTFAAYASAMIADLGEAARPYLKSWYMGVKYDPRAAGFDGMSSAAEVDAADVNAITTETDNVPAELDQSGARPLEGVPTDAVPGTESVGQTGTGAETGGGTDVRGSGSAGKQRGQSGRSVADGAGKVPAAAAGDDAAKPARNQQRRDRGNESRTAADRVDQPDQPRRTIDELQGVESAATPAQNLPVDYTITADDKIGQGGEKAKFRGNVAAIETLRALETENRPATREEQAVLAKWVGWGGLRNAFFRDDGTAAKGWEKQAAELKALLTPEEYRAAEASTRNAHYTSPEVVDAVWNVARRLGFRGGQVLEPSVGAGNFLGLMPGQVKDATHVTGVELDRITGGIAKNLYPGANIQAPMGFEVLTVPNDYFDLAIGNPPFGSERLYDKNRRHLNKLSIHNFFFAKSIEALRPGGVLAMVVTNRFLDGNNSAARALIAKQADLVGAIRLPNNAFLKNAGTEVTTDIVILRKRMAGDEAGSTAWVDVGEYRGADGKTVPLNRYFIDNPGMMLGDFGAYGTMYGPDEPALVARKGQDLAADLQAAIAKLPQNVMPEPGVVARPTETVAEGVEDVTVGSAFIAPDGTVHVRKQDSLGQPQSETVEFPNDRAKERVTGLIRIRDVFARLRRAQISDTATDAQLNNLRAQLNKAYDAFVAKNGPINHDSNKRLFRDDPTWPQLSALENNFDKGVSDAVAKSTGEAPRAPKADKAPIFTKRTQQPYRRPTRAATAKDALAQVLNDRGRVDLDEMSRLYGKPADEIVTELGPLIYQTPAGSYETADAYLSGNVKQKLAEAERAAEQDPTFRRNVAALRDVIPADIEAVDIDVKAGAPWVPPQHVARFVEHIAGAAGARAVYSRSNNNWVLDIPRATPAADAMWATSRASLPQVLDAAINGKSAKVYTKDADGNDVIDQAATEAANEKVSRVREEWNRWVWQDDARRAELARLYNDTFNTDVIRVYDGSHLTLPGKVSDSIIDLRPHQKSFVWRTLQSAVSLADHTVGAGKTFALIASVMEKRRTGQAKKPVLTVPNHLVGQWAADFQKLYPGAKVLAPTKRDFEKQNRKRLVARIATGDWDVVILAHSQFGLIGVTPETEAKFIQGQISDLEQSIQEMRRETGEKSRNVAQLAKQRQNLETKIKGLLDAGRKDDGLYFDDLGVDALYVDEFHEFKNLPFVTGMQRVAGLGNPAGSQKATDMFIKIQNVIERTGGNIVVATGTPLSNTMAEMYTVQRYLANGRLQQLGLSHFDAWARVFGEAVTDWELSPSGQYKLNTRFAKFVNMPELMKFYLSFADVITNDDIKRQLAAMGKTLPLPKVKGGKPTNITVERSPDQATYIGEGRMDANGELRFPEGSLVYRAENLPKKAEKGADNMLKVMSDARKAALDMRLIDPSYADYAGSKINRAADEMMRIYQAWNDRRGTQLVFIDLSTPKKAKAKQEAELRALIQQAEQGDEAAQEKLDAMSPDEFLALASPFSVYDDLRQKLIERGVPADQIAFIHDANTELQKEELFGKVRSGRVRFLFGSTPKMGAGTNVQNRLVALHHLDAPWRPSDLEQRDGRIIRQGNDFYADDPEGFEVEILRYATKNTLDARQWQGIEAKARFIGQVRKGDIKTRQIEDIAGEAANAAEMKAAASGNPLILEEMETKRKLRTLEAQSSEHDRNQHRIRDKIRQANEEVQQIEKRLPAVKQDAAAAEKLMAEPFSAVVEGVTVEKPKEFGAALLAQMRRAIVDGVTDETDVGRYGDFKISTSHLYDARFSVSIDGARPYSLVIEDVGQQDPTGLAMSVMNTVRRLPKLPANDLERIDTLQQQIPQLEKQIGPWPNQDELDETAAKHRRLLDALRPKKPAEKPAAAAVRADDVLPVIENKRPDPVVRTSDDLKPVVVPARRPDESLMEWSFRIIGDHNHTTGHEYLLAIDDDGSVVEYGTRRDPTNTGMSNKIAGAVMNPDRQLVIFHNHPKNGGLSAADLSFMVYPGIHAVWAIGAQGRNVRMEPTARMRQWRSAFSNDTKILTHKNGDFLNALRMIDNMVYRHGKAQIDRQAIDVDTANKAYQASLQEIVQRAGIIDYFTNWSYDFSVVPGLDALIDKMAKELEKAVFNGQGKSSDAGAGRSAKPLRHVAELEGMARSGGDMVAQDQGARGLSEAGPRNDPGEERGTINRERIADELKGRLTDLTPAVLKAIPLNYFSELARPNMVAVGDYLRVKRLMDAFRGQKHADADKIAGDWLKFTRLGFMSRDKAKAQALADLMHDSTIFGVDPSSTDEEMTVKGYYPELRKRYLALPPAGQALYQRVRDAYLAQSEELDNILLDNVRKAQEIARQQADRRYKRTLEQIRDAGLDPIARRKAEEDAASAYKAETTKNAWAAKARMTKLRIAFESSRVQPPYFPLGRFGRYFVTVREVDGSVVSFSKFEKAADRDRFAREAAAMNAAWTVEKGVMDEGADLRNAMDPRMVAEIETILGGAGVDPEVMDAIWQRYLETMPDLSTRKRFIHRKGTRGFERDALRVFSSHMFHAAHQMAKVKFGLELQELVSQARDQARESDDPTKGTTLANELAKRHDWVMNPTGGKVAQIMTSAAFVWFLAATPAAAVLNMTQTVMMGVPILAGRFGGFNKAGAALLKASMDSVKGRGSITSANLTADERRAIEAFYDSGLIDRTQSHELAGVGDTGVEYSPLRARVMGVISWAFHRAEVWNREVTALAAYRMAKAAGQNHMEAVDTAHDLTWKTHFDYSNSSRPAIMQNDLAKVALVFRNYNVNMLYRMFRDIHQSLKGESPQARKEARYQLAGVLGMQALMAGVTGVAGFNLAMAVLGLVFGDDDDDPLGFEQSFRADVVDILGPELGGVVLNGIPGHYLGVDLTSRIGMPDLWFRSPNKELQGKEEFQYWLTQTLGATVGLGENLWNGVNLMLDGEVARGIEMAAPKPIRDLMKTYRYATEGLTTLDGNTIMSPEDIGYHGMVMQALGFTPASVAEVWDRNTALKNAETRIMRERQRLITKFAMAAIEDDEKALDAANAAIDKFNAKPIHEGVPITADTLKRSIKTRVRVAANRDEQGALIRNAILGERLRSALSERIYD